MQQHRVPQGTYTGVAAPSSLSCTPRRASLYHQRRREYAAALFGGSALVCRNAKKEDVPSPQEPAQPQEQPAPQAEGVVADFDMEVSVLMQDHAGDAQAPRPSAAVGFMQLLHLEIP